MTLTLVLAAVVATAADRPDIVLADFEGKDYGGWVSTGTAFGKGPSIGALPGQMSVSGFLGRRLANSFVGGDATTGTLTSPSFVVERPFINFLIGGGKYPGETCLNLMVNGRIVRTATGPNDRPGGSEQLDWASWDVRDLVGKKAVLQIVDKRKGGWGHINVDQITQSDQKKGLDLATRRMLVESRYLHLPVKQAAPVRRVKITDGQRTLREFDIKLSPAGETPDFWVFADLAGQKGRTVSVEAMLPGGARELEAVKLAEKEPGTKSLYREAHRPQFHFTSRRGWHNDPNGLVWNAGLYHLFYQHNPYGWEWGNMHWGHATSPDLVHWTEQGDAIAPRKYGDWVFSGSAVVDLTNSSGWATGGKPAMVAAFTSTGRGECIVHSGDGGLTWTEFEGNPVVKHQGRDPRLLWHAPTKRWIMAVYDEKDGKKWIAFHSSPDFKTWKAEGRIEGFYECPDLFEIPVSGQPGKSRWVIYAADGEYLVGRFDGHDFKPESPAKRRVWYGNFYAAQSYSNSPDGRRVQIGWGQGIAFEGMPFNQQMTVPVELTLRPTSDGFRLFARPVAELQRLRAKTHSSPGPVLKPGEGLKIETSADLLEARLTAGVGTNSIFTATVRDVPVVFDAAHGSLTCAGVSAPLAVEDGKIQLHILVDRGSVEVFANDGRVAISKGVIPSGSSHGIGFKAEGSEVSLSGVEVYELSSAWPAAGETR
jgi:fructan beta-fructosidase